MHHRFFKSYFVIISAADFIWALPRLLVCQVCSTIAAVYNQGTTITITATPTAGFMFAGWSGCSGTTCVLTLISATMVTATFQQTIENHLLRLLKKDMQVEVSDTTMML